MSSVWRGSRKWPRRAIDTVTPQYFLLGSFLLLITIALLNVWVAKREKRLEKERAEERQREYLENTARREAFQEECRERDQVHLAERLDSIKEVGKFLAAGDFFSADRYTSHALRNHYGELDIDYVDVEILEELDRLWSNATDGRFGFRAQLGLGETQDEIIAAAEIPHWWDWPNTRFYEVTAPSGHLPMDWLFGEEIRGMDDDRALRFTGQFEKLRAKLSGGS